MASTSVLHAGERFRKHTVVKAMGRKATARARRTPLAGRRLLEPKWLRRTPTSAKHKIFTEWLSVELQHCTQESFGAEGGANPCSEDSRFVTFSGVYLGSVSLGCVSGVFLWGVSLGCVSRVSLECVSGVVSSLLVLRCVPDR